MKKIWILAFFLILTLFASIFILNVEVTTRQGINYKVYTLEIPLYLKILDFYDRHYNYRWLAHKITTGKNGDEEKVMAIFKWTVGNIAKQPKELKVVDDHVWHIIVRGYGTHDQFSDVFTTLCNYAGIDAFFARLFKKNSTSQRPFSFVKMNKKWCLFDPYSGTYFIKEDGSFVSVQDIAIGKWMEKSIEEEAYKKEIQYEEYFSEILSIDFEESHKWSRANLQSPIRRFLYGVVKRKF